MRKINIFLSSLCCMLVCFVSIGFSGCELGAEHTYNDVKSEYNAMLDANQDIFNTIGEVEIVYNNVGLKNAISSNAVDTEFGKLSASSNNKYAIFEPALKASLLVVNKYINNDYPKTVVFNKSKTSALYNQLQVLKEKLKDFTDAKSYLEDKVEFSANGATEKFWRDKLFERFSTLISASCDFGLTFADIYKNSIFIDKEYVVGSRYALGKMQLEYLMKLAEYAQITEKTTIALEFDEVVGSTAPMPIVNTLLREYYKVSNSNSWQGDNSVSLSENETSVINAFTAMLEYNKTYQIIRSQFMEAINEFDYTELVKIDNSTDKTMTIEQSMAFAKINNFINTDCVNITSYMQTFTSALQTYLAG